MFDRTWTVVMPANGGPDVIVIDNVELPGGDPTLELSAWNAALEGANVYLFEDGVTLLDAQNRLAVKGKVDCLMVVPRAGTARVRCPGDIAKRISVFFDTAFANIQAVTVRLRELP